MVLVEATNRLSRDRADLFWLNKPPTSGFSSGGPIMDPPDEPAPFGFPRNDPRVPFATVRLCWLCHVFYPFAFA
jgi:hypothetical protein